ncbi:unnamed protein product, partial [Mesorhabditis belari]|uniref:Uncharacterized protein n=1 Tax=Mesorhabditis belari TaxID=2138241 RepID=A0AAF3EAH7_9BILA
MFGGWFPHTSEPSDFSNSEPPCSISGVLLASVFVVPYLAFLVVLPGIRGKRVISLVTLTINFFVGGALISSIVYPGWAIGQARIVSQFRAHTRERILSRLGVNVGLTHLNITLRHERQYQDATDKDDHFMGTVPNFTKLYFNERFDISGVSSMAEALRNAYFHGLPYPILSVLEYFSLNQDSFDWGRHYRVAGHYAYAAMSLATAFWSLAIVCQLFLPHMYGCAQLACGLASIGGIIIYVLISPAELLIAFVGEDGNRTIMDMKFGWCFYLIIAQAILSIAFGLSLMLLQHFRLYSLSTFLDASLDETVGPSKRRNLALTETKSGQDNASSLEVMRRAKTSTAVEPCSTSQHSKHSSGIHSRSSYSTDTASIHSSGSFGSVKSLSPPARNLTLRSRKSEELQIQSLMDMRISIAILISLIGCCSCACVTLYCTPLPKFTSTVECNECSQCGKLGFKFCGATSPSTCGCASMPPQGCHFGLQSNTSALQRTTFCHVLDAPQLPTPTIRRLGRSAISIVVPRFFKEQPFNAFNLHNLVIFASFPIKNGTDICVSKYHIEAENRGAQCVLRIPLSMPGIDHKTDYVYYYDDGSEMESEISNDFFGGAPSVEIWLEVTTTDKVRIDRRGLRFHNRLQSPKITQTFQMLNP